ncbi:ATP-dependent DNA helicase [Bifidobacterium margollesii]|uniref:DNA 3'-5' helicase n=1 Tax=Bifidobacterium margollesii TaxID=2020964 RepID=A0A2N5JCX4_9BIFI|nr:ATP-dependent DNA helicase [Bifidobacterium margollesii]PLS32067.1 ATP-dependent DNA helicase [Bifidobacterium margollesii]
MTKAFTPTAEQASVIDAPADDDVLVVAGAGSGKTFTMTRRIISLIDRGVPAERILGLTFTRKAASELLSRVSAAVTATASQEPGASGAFLKPEIFTYDAFFQSIVRQYGLLVGMDRSTQPLSEAGAYQLASDVIGRHMDLLFGRNPSSDNNSTDGTASDGTATGGGDADDMGAFGTVVTRMLALCSDISSSMIGGDCMSFHDAVERIRHWDDAFEHRLAELIGDREIPEKAPNVKYPTRRKKDDDESWAAKLAEYDRARQGLMLFNANALRSVVRRREILLTLAEEFQKAKHEQNMAQFSDFTIAAYQLVRRFPSIGEEYRRRYSHVFLDEYQDTSTTQSALLAALFHPERPDSEDLGSGHDSTARLAQRHSTGSRRSAVNAVGDPFQSIYAWRGASPGAFRMFQQDFSLDDSSKPRPLTLTRRNSRLVLEAANDLTIALRQAPARRGSSLMREVDVPALTCLPDADLGTLGVLGFTTLGQEIDAVVRFAHQTVERYRVEDANGERKAGPHVAVLFRSKTAMPQYRAALEASGLTCEVVGYSALLEQPPVKDLLAVLHAVSDHTDSASLMQLLATKRFGLGPDDLAALAGLAERANIEYQYRALAESGVVPSDAPRKQWARLVADHRDRISNGVFLIDVLLRDDLSSLLGSTVSPRGGILILKAAQVLRTVERSMHRALPDIIRCAVESLGLDIDTVVARSIAYGNEAGTPTSAREPLQSIIDLTAAYMQEIPERSTPSLRGFMAWVDALGTVPESAAAHIDKHVDVTLMSIHQAKGLEWDAVAVVGMKRHAFPSNQGDHLSIKADPDHLGGVHDGIWSPPQYRESARVWLENPTAVPVPVRADAGILPRFPHDADVEHPSSDYDLHGIDSLYRLQCEVYGDESARESGDDDGTAPSYLSQREEYGRRLHDDERRLAYVALTRARKAVLLTFSATGDLASVPAADCKPLDVETKASNFWMEMHEAFVGRPEAVREPSSVDPNTADAGRRDSVVGFFIGDNAEEYENAIVGGCLAEPRSADGSRGDELSWPAPLDDRAAQALNASAEAVRNAMKALQSAGSEKDSAEGGVVPDPDGLLSYARQITVMNRETQAVPKTGEGRLAALKAKGERILAGGRQNVTSIQARAGLMDEREALSYWSGIVRPVPRVVSPNAQAGTIFHDWAARFICPQSDAGERLSPEEIRASMLEELSREEQALPSSSSDRSESSRASWRMLQWRRRLAESVWAGRRAVSAERSIVVDIDGLIVNGKLDAVFRGGLDPHDGTKLLTVIDWKTGAKPRDTQDIRRKLAQLDMYRLLLSRLEGIPLESIDAALYYVSVADERQRQLCAEAKTESEIIREMSLGLPEQSDND